MNLQTKKTINIFLITVICVNLLLIIINLTGDKPKSITTENSKSEANNIVYSNEINSDTKVTLPDYKNNVKYTNDLFKSILNKHNIQTITTDTNSNNLMTSESSILLSELNIPNGYKTIISNPQNNEYTLLYISLINTLNNNETWNQTLNISLSSTGNILEFNEVNYPEIFELLDAFKFNTSELSVDVNNIFTNKESNIAKKNYIVSRDNSSNPNFTQLSIHLGNGKIKKG